MRHFSQKKESKDVTISLFLQEVEQDMERLKRSLHPEHSDSMVKEGGLRGTETEGEGENEGEVGEWERQALDWDEYLADCSDVDQPKGINEFQPLVGRGMYVHQLRS